MPETSQKPYLKLPQKTECMDCGNCRAVCKNKVLGRKEISSGFIITIAIAPSLCISCGACLKACPVINTTTQQTVPMPEFYAAWHKDPAVVKRSSSGGVFTGLAQYVIRKKGIVAGVVLQNNRTAYKIAETEEDLQAMQGSKYLPSSIAEIFPPVCSALKKGQSVLCVGLPCQIAGLKQRMNQENIHGDLIAVDLLCAGTPAPRLLDFEIAEKGIAIKGFRDKNEHSWMNSQVLSCVNLQTGQKKILEKKQSDFLRAFHANLVLRDICYHCPFAKLPRSGDISIGDFWGIQNFNEHIHDGISLTTVNTPRGKNLWEQSANFIEYHPVSFCEAAQQNTRLYSGLKPMKNHWLHKSLDFFCAHLPYKIIKWLYCGPHRLFLLGRLPYNLLYHSNTKKTIRQINSRLFNNLKTKTKVSS